MRRTAVLHRRAALAAAVATLMTGLAAAPSMATGTDPVFIGWSQTLPASAYDYEPSSEDACKAGKPACVEATLKRMQRQASSTAAACDHRAVFSLAYYRTTQAYARVAADPDFLEDARFVNHEDAVFAAFYFDAYDNWSAGKHARVPAAWRIAFDAAEDRSVSGSGDLMLGMSAHVNRDLPFVLAGIGLVRPDGTSRKADHDKINEMLNTVVAPLIAEEARRFDASMDDTATPYGLSYTAMMQALVSWRENAWRNAERLAAAPDKASRQAVAQQIEDYAATVGRGLVANYAYRAPVTTGADRDSYCAARRGA
jgi:hypothetical protein